MCYGLEKKNRLSYSNKVFALFLHSTVAHCCFNFSIVTLQILKRHYFGTFKNHKIQVSQSGLLPLGVPECTKQMVCRYTKRSLPDAVQRINNEKKKKSCKSSEASLCEYHPSQHTTQLESETIHQRSPLKS